jgi:acyl-CoA synthetase (AMP-forming)/AMP-acid ligase II/acyl carrier protein
MGPTLIHRLETHCGAQGWKPAFRFLSSGKSDGPIEVSTFSDLAIRARSIAAELADYRGQTVLLLYPSGSEFVAAFLGCLYAGAIAVPAYPPEEDRLRRTLPRLQAIARDSRARLILSTRAVRAMAPAIAAAAPELGALPWIATETISDNDRASIELPREEGAIAFLQYTSGSTGDPKGVMVSHANLNHNAAMLEAAWPGGAEHEFVCWLPLHHDMGLIMNVLQTVQTGASCTLLTPLQFLSRPRCWLEAISTFRGTISMAPNFAYELCLKKISPADLQGLALETWRVAVNAAEPTRPHTMEAFSDRFAPIDFRAESFQPAWGLAETTVFVAARGTGRGLRSISISSRELEHGRVIPAEGSGRDVQRFAAHGQPWLDQEVVLVDPETLRRSAPGQVGEIWLRGPSVALGYWKRPDATAATYGARLADSGEGPFLRTGDLAFIEDSELYICGRLKDLIILRGANHYPQDIELSVQEAHPEIRPGCVIAFAVDDGAAERLVVVAETRAGCTQPEGEAIAEKVRRAVLERHDLPLEALVLIAPKSIHKTSSGKLQRRLCRSSFINGKLEEVFRWERPRVEAPPSASTVMASNLPPPRPGASELFTFVREWLARSLRIDLQTGDLSMPFADLGVDSAASAELAAALGNFLGREVPPTTVWTHPTVPELIRHLASASEPAHPRGFDALDTQGVELQFARELSKGSK